METRLRKYQAIGLRKVEHDSPVKETLGSGAFLLQDNSVLVTESDDVPKQEQKEEQQEDHKDNASDSDGEDELPSITIEPDTSTRFSKGTQEQAVSVRVAFSGVQLALKYDAVFISDSCVVLRGPDPAPFDPIVDETAQEQPVYELTVHGKAYRCVYGGVSYKETSTTKTLVLFRE